MKIAIMSFTSSGNDISKQITSALLKAWESYDVTEINKNTFDDKLSKHMNEIFSSNDALIFISSTGIALRLIAPHVESKVKDPAVIVIDDLGRFTISLLSGHIGGANDLTHKVSDVLNNQAIITTASDGRGIDAVDTFSLRNNLYIEDMEQAKLLTSLMIEGERIRLVSEINLKLNYGNVEDTDNLQDDKHDVTKGIIIVSSLENVEGYLSESDYNKSICILRPRNLNLGIGCRRGKTKEEILSAITEIFKDYNLSLNSITKIGTIDIKHDEVGIIEVSKELNAEMVLFAKSEIESVSDKFSKSDFVKMNVGVSSVCEPTAYLLGEEIIVSKKIFNGVTIAVSRSEKNG